MDSADKVEYCERRVMSGACRSCGDHPGWVEFVFGPEVTAEPGMELKGRKLEMDFSRLYADSLREKGWKLGTGGIERCPGCREMQALREAKHLHAFARRVWGLLADTPDLVAVAELLNAEPTVDEQAIAAELKVRAAREGVKVEELHEARLALEEEVDAFYAHGVADGLLSRITMRFERDVGPWFPLPLQTLLLEEYGELPAGVAEVSAPSEVLMPEEEAERPE